MEEDLPTKWREKKKKVGIAILVSDKIDFKATKTKRDKERHYIMVKGSIQQEQLTILNIYVPNTGAPRYIRQVLNDLQRDLNSHAIIVGDFNTPLSVLDRSTRQKNQQGYPGLELRPGASKPDRHLQNSPPQIHRIHILLSTTSHLL